MIEDPRLDDDVLILNDELILGAELGGENAIPGEAGVLLLSDELLPEPVIKKVDVGPRVTGFASAPAAGGAGDRLVTAEGWRITEPPRDEPKVVRDPVWQDLQTAPGPRSAAQPADLQTAPAGLAAILSEARRYAAEYGLMQARTRTALYQALGQTYDLTVYAADQPAEFARLIKDADLTVQDRAPYSPVVKLVFGADYDKTRITEFAAAIMYGRRKNLPVGSFTEFLNQFDGGLRAVVGLERLIRKGDQGVAELAAQAGARPAIARKLREIRPKAWDDLAATGEEFALLVVRRLPDGSVAMVGEVPRDIALLEKAARKLLAEIGKSHAPMVQAAGSPL